MQGGSAHGLALTAYTLVAFLENSRATPLYRLVRQLDFGIHDSSLANLTLVIRFNIKILSLNGMGLLGAQGVSRRLLFSRNLLSRFYKGGDVHIILSEVLN